MTHNMQLNHEPFVSIRAGKKTIEMRLFDEKRQRINIGDSIEFTDRTNGDSMSVRVIALHRFATFDDLYAHFDKEKLGYDETEIARPGDMSKYYSREEIARYGVLGIEISREEDKKD